jgi:SAM-dependent methyltransferase
MDDADGYFPERVAATYDDSSDGMFDPAFTDTVAALLAELAGGGRALELGIGTGRIALPLARRGVQVDGIDLSRAMVAGCGPSRAATPSASPSGTSRRPGWTARSPSPTWSSTRSRT